MYRHLHTYVFIHINVQSSIHSLTLPNTPSCRNEHMITCILSGYNNILNVFLLHPHKQVQQPLRHTILLLTAACAAALETMPESWQSFCFVQRDAGPERCRGHPAGHSQMCWVGRGGLHSCLHRQCGNNNDNGHLAHLTCDDPKC